MAIKSNNNQFLAASVQKWNKKRVVIRLPIRSGFRAELYTSLVENKSITNLNLLRVRYFDVEHIIDLLAVKTYNTLYLDLHMLYCFERDKLLFEALALTKSVHTLIIRVPQYDDILIHNIWISKLLTNRSLRRLEIILDHPHTEIGPVVEALKNNFTLQFLGLRLRIHQRRYFEHYGVNEFRPYL